MKTDSQSATVPAVAAEERRKPRLLLVTGLAGAGHSSALHCLEDLDYEAVDNLPLALLPHLLPSLGEEPAFPPPAIAIGIDSRTRDFTIENLTALIERMRADPRIEFQLIFLECEDEVLRRRFTETRRRHPLAQDRPIADGIRQERRLMRPLRTMADLVIDTSDKALGDLKALLKGHYELDRLQELAITVMSFSFRMGLPREADLVFDVRFLQNPYYDPALRPFTGLDERVGRAIEADAAFPRFFGGLTDMVLPLLPGYEREGKSYLTIAIGCTGGRHRSVYVARRLSQWLAAHGRTPTLRHRDLGRAEHESLPQE